MSPHLTYVSLRPISFTVAYGLPLKDGYTFKGLSNVCGGKKFRNTMLALQ